MRVTVTGEAGPGRLPDRSRPDEARWRGLAAGKDLGGAEQVKGHGKYETRVQPEVKGEARLAQRDDVAGACISERRRLVSRRRCGLR